MLSTAVREGSLGSLILTGSIESFYVSRGIGSARIRPEDMVRAIMGEKN